MCIDLFVPRLSIEVPFLQEQIWIGLRKDDASKIDVTEVYDLRIRNPQGNPTIDELWALFPNDCTKIEGGRRSPLVTAWLTTPDAYERMNEEGRNYEWAFTRPEWVDNREESVRRGYCAVPVDPRGPSFSKFPGKVLKATVGFPDPPLSADLQKVMAEEPILKTLVSLSLGQTALKPGEEGWLRLKVTPAKLDQNGPRKTPLGESLPTLFSQTLTATCPILVRDRLRARLDVGGYTTKAELANMYHDLRRIVLTDGIYAPGTGLRIADHRVAIIAYGAVDISNANRTDAALYYGIIPLLDHETQTSLWWGCGSDRNLQSDLVHNAGRVIDLLNFGGQPREKRDISLDLSPSGKHEAFCTLLDEMVKAGLLVCGPGGQMRLPDEFGNNRDQETIKLRQAYAKASVFDELRAVDFCDLHPFCIDYRASWFAKV